MSPTLDMSNCSTADNWNIHFQHYGATLVFCFLRIAIVGYLKAGGWDGWEEDVIKVDLPVSVSHQHHSTAAFNYIFSTAMKNCTA